MPPESTAGGALARLVGDVEHFAQHIWGREPMLRRTEDSCSDNQDAAGDHSFTDVWSVDALDQFLTSAIRRPLIRLVTVGTPLDAAAYTSRRRLGGRDFDDVIDPAKVAEQFAAGATVVAQSLHRTHSDVKRFVEQLADDIDHPIQANSYLTPPGAVGLAPHADRHDVFVIQLSGTKNWTLDGLGDVRLAPGDTMYVPVGCRHSAASDESASLHLTIGVLRVTYRSVVDRILSSGPDVLDQPLPLRFRNNDDEGSEDSIGDDLSGVMSTVVGAVTDHLASIDIAEVVRDERSRNVSRPPRPGALVSAVELADLSGSARVVATTSDWTVTIDGGRCTAAAGSRQLTAPASCAAALRQVAGGESVRVDELPGLDRPSQLILARRLVTAGLCNTCSAS